MPLQKHIVSSGQSLVDIAIQRYGRADAVFELLELNPSFVVSDSLSVGQVLLYDQSEGNQVSELFRKRGYVVNMRQGPKCGNITSEMFLMDWNTTWDGTKHKVNSLAITPHSLLASAEFSEDIQLYTAGGVYVGTSNPSFATPQYDEFQAKDAAYGQINLIGDFGFLPGEYRLELQIDDFVMVDGTACSDFKIVVDLSWPDLTGLCLAPTNLTVVTTTPTSVVLEWDAVFGASSYFYRIREVGNVAWVESPIYPNTIISTAFLQSGATYEVQVRTNCTSGGVSPWVSTQFIAQDPPVTNNQFNYALQVSFQQ